MISPVELIGAFTNAWFYTGADGGMVFRVPVTGGTTSSSDFPRSELREMLDPEDNRVNWSAPGVHILNAQCRVTQIPSSMRVIIGQIHSYLGSAPPLVKLEYANGVVQAAVKLVSTTSTDTRFPLAQVGLNQDINYQIRMSDGLVSIAVNGNVQSVNVFETDPAWAAQTFYFKAGNYCLDNFGTSEEGSVVSFYQLSVEHMPPCLITNVSANATEFCLAWTSRPGCSYFVQGATSLNSADWLTLSPVLTATNALTSWCVALPTPSKFFRVGLQSPQPQVKEMP